MSAASPLDSARIVLIGTTNWLTSLEARLDHETAAAVTRLDTAEAGLGFVRQDHVDCVVTEYELEDGSGLDVARDVRAHAPTVPVVLGTAAGDETVARDAITAQVASYIIVDEPLDGTIDTAIQRLESALQAARTRKTRRERAQQFDAVFADTETAKWVLDPDGTIVRANQPAHGLVDDPGEPGAPFWELGWLTHSEAIQNDIKHLIETVHDGTVSTASIRNPLDDDPDRVFELAARLVEAESGEPTSIVVEAHDVTDRVSLERDLRQSEELHRVTLNNMTDTVLITDGSGAYTYVCPNVHFIFGYTAEEIRTQGSIDELLGPDLLDRAELDEKGILKNIECTATDKAGREHTLLVNVRKVDIQEGKLLYSCRDITKRKQREEALATLQELSRSFLYAGTHDEIARHIVEEAPSAMDLDVSAVYLFNPDTNELEPAAQSQAVADLHGPLPPVHADDDTLPGLVFVTGSTEFFDDVHTADRLDNQATDLRSAAFIPLGDHGVFLAGSTDIGVFDEVTRELADLLAATAEAALDRVSRESQLREQDRRLQQQNEQLSALNRINETIRAIDQAVVQAETRDEIDHAVCELLTSDDRFRFAWIGAVHPGSETLTPRAWAGDEQGYLDAQTFAVGMDDTEPAGETAATREITMVSNVAAELREESWRTAALTRDFMSVLSIPLVYNELTHGILTVYADTRDAFDETGRTVLAELGETIGSALSAIERRNALLTTSMTRVTFDIDDQSFVLSRLATDASCTLSYQGGVQQTESGSYVFVTVKNGSIETVETAARDLVGVDDVRRVSVDGDGGVLRLELTNPFLALELADHGAIFREATADPTATTITIDVPDGIDVRRIRQLVSDRFSSVELASKQTRDRAAESDVPGEFLSAVTDRQLEVVQTAYFSGFFDSPRESDGEDIAAMLDISPQAFYEHIRTVQRKLFMTLFEEGVNVAPST